MFDPEGTKYSSSIRDKINAQEIANNEGAVHRRIVFVFHKKTQVLLS